VTTEVRAPSAVEAVAAAHDRIEADGRAGIWIEVLPRARTLAAAAAVDAAVAAGEPRPLAGLTAAVKANMDVAGLQTTAGCPSYGAGTTPARSARAVRALEAAGAVVVGVTNLDQFATGLVGTRSPHGVCPNAHWPGLVAGGSSSGSAVAVAAGLVDVALGTDTAGTRRVPAAANGIVGAKPTRGRISTAGVVPACRSLDCVSVFAATVARAVQVVDLLAGPDSDDPWSRTPPGLVEQAPRGRPWRLAVPDPAVTPGLDPAAVAALVAATGAEVRPVDLTPFLAAGRLLYEGAFVAERYEAVGAFLETEPAGVDPVVDRLIRAAGRLPAWQLARDRSTLAALAARVGHVWRTADALVVPTVPRIPTVAEVAADPIGVNAELGTYTNAVNLLDQCALTIPVGPPATAGPPASLMLVAPAGADGWLAALGGALA
jgi:allophanate hydrolase